MGTVGIIVFVLLTLAAVAVGAVLIYRNNRAKIEREAIRVIEQATAAEDALKKKVGK